MAARRRPTTVAPTRRRSATVALPSCSPTFGPGASWAAGHDQRSGRAEDGCPAHSVGARRIGSGVAESSRSHDFGVPATSTCGGAGVVAATRHPVQTPARRCHGGLPLVDATAGSPAGAWTRCIPAATRDRCAQVDVADYSKRRLPRRFRDTNGVRRAPTECAGHSSSALQRPSIVVSGWGYTAAGRRRAATDADRGRASASSYRGLTPELVSRRRRGRAIAS
jgi:hypothetical protein